MNSKPKKSLRTETVNLIIEGPNGASRELEDKNTYSAISEHDIIAHADSRVQTKLDYCRKSNLNKSWENSMLDHIRQTYRVRISSEPQRYILPDIVDV
jgi:hypothetical protein